MEHPFPPPIGIVDWSARTFAGIPMQVVAIVIGAIFGAGMIVGPLAVPFLVRIVLIAVCASIVMMMVIPIRGVALWERLVAIVTISVQRWLHRSTIEPHRNGHDMPATSGASPLASMIQHIAQRNSSS